MLRITHTGKSVNFPVTKLSSAKNYFNFKQPFMWTSHFEQDCSCVKKPRGRPPYQANKQLVSKADRTAFPEIHPELPQLRDISYNINFSVKIADEIEANTLFDRSLPSTRCFLDISPQRAPFKPVSQRIWTTLRRFGSPHQTFLLSIDCIIFDN